MKQVFVDTNILLDYLFERKGFYKNAEKLFDYCAMRNIKVNISSLSVATIAYLLSKKFRINEVKEQLEILYGFTNILPLTKESSSQLINPLSRIQKTAFSILPPKNTISPFSSLAISKTLPWTTSLYYPHNSSQKSWQSDFLPIAAKTS